jgi:hypothetical protein
MSLTAGRWPKRCFQRLGDAATRGKHSNTRVSCLYDSQNTTSPFTTSRPSCCFAAQALRSSAWTTHQCPPTPWEPNCRADAAWWWSPAHRRAEGKSGDFGLLLRTTGCASAWNRTPIETSFRRCHPSSVDESLELGQYVQS